MEKSYTDTFELRSLACDMQGRWKPGAILETMQEIAGDHCARLGLPRPVMDGLGIAWVLSRVRVQLKRQPRMGETISASTWPLPPRHLFYPRVNAFLDGEGNEIGAASSLWLLMDLNTRRVVNSDAVLARLPDNADMPAGIAIGAARPLAGEAVVKELVAPYSDFDLNGHVNNTRYLDWTMNALGHGVLAEKWISDFCVSYDREVRPDEVIRTELVRDGDRFSFCGSAGSTDSAGSTRCFCVSGVLRERD